MKRVLFVLFLILQSQSTHAQGMPFDIWLSDLAGEAMAQGISRATVEDALNGIEPDERVVELDQKQPESSITFETYEARILSRARVEEGRKLLD